MPARGPPTWRLPDRCPTDTGSGGAAPPPARPALRYAGPRCFCASRSRPGAEGSAGAGGGGVRPGLGWALAVRGGWRSRDCEDSAWRGQRERGALTGPGTARGAWRGGRGPAAAAAPSAPAAAPGGSGRSSGRCERRLRPVLPGPAALRLQPGKDSAHPPRCPCVAPALQGCSPAPPCRPGGFALSPRSGPVGRLAVGSPRGPLSPHPCAARLRCQERAGAGSAARGEHGTGTATCPGGSRSGGSDPALAAHRARPALHTCEVAKKGLCLMHNLLNPKGLLR